MSLWNSASDIDYLPVEFEWPNLFPQTIPHDETLFTSFNNSLPSSNIDEINMFKDGRRGLYEDMEAFRNKHISQWTEEDSFDWALATCRENGINHSDFSLNVFKLVPAAELCGFTLQEFKKLTNNEFYGYFFYEKFQEFARRQGFLQQESPDEHSTENCYGSLQEPSATQSSTFVVNNDSCGTHESTYTDLSGPTNCYRECNNGLSDLLDASFESINDEFSYDILNSSSAELFDHEIMLTNISDCHSNSGTNTLTDDLNTLIMEDPHSLSTPYEENLANTKSKDTIPEKESLHVDCSTSTDPDDNKVLDEVCSSDHWFEKIPTGGPRKKYRIRSPKSWEFVLRLLQDPRTNPRLIKWENEEQGVFRFVQKEVIAQMWGRRASSQNGQEPLQYESFARLLRHHYKSKSVMQVRERQMVYKFGPEVLKELKHGRKY